MLFQSGYQKVLMALALSAGLLAQVPESFAHGNAVSIGIVSPMPTAPIGRIHAMRQKRIARPAQKTKARQTKATAASTKVKAGKASLKNKKAAKAPAAPLRPPQDELGAMSTATLAPGVVHKCHRGPLNINILDVDLTNPNIEVKPVLAGDTFNRLDEVRDQAQKVNAIAAVNANYFKKDGTPLGTLIIDGEWVAGPLYDRISFGLTESGEVHVDRANLHGTIETSNPALGRLWVNNINQPRRHGCKLVAYTRRWGSSVKMPYSGILVAVDANGRVVDKATQNIAVPYGGFVLSDTTNALISKLERGDLVHLQWHHKPEPWSDVIQAVSGGPTLIRNGQLYLDLKDENFRKTWTSNTIHARTALGVTRNHHLILATIEGPHTLWDVAKMLHRLGCVEAMNLDGGGSTTMVLNGNIVTKNKNTFQRRVAASLAVLPRKTAPSIATRKYGQYIPSTDVSAVPSTDETIAETLKAAPVADPVVEDVHERAISGEAENPELTMQSQKLPMSPIMTEAPAQTQKQSKRSKASKFGWMKLIKLNY